MHITLDRRHHDMSLAAGGVAAEPLFPLDVRHQHGNRLLHHPGAFDDLGKEHLAVAKQVSHHVHSVHQRTLDDFQRPRRLLTRFFGVLLNVAVDTLDQCMHQAVMHRKHPPLRVAYFFAGAALEFLRQFQQALGGFISSVQYQIFNRGSQPWIDFVVDFQLTGIDDGHVHSSLDCVVKEYGVNGFSYPVLTTKRK